MTSHQNSHRSESDPNLRPSDATRSRTGPAPASLSVHSSADVVELVPFVFGFHPRNSVCVLAVREHRLAAACRLDLEVALRPEQCRQLISAAVHPVTDAPAEGVLIVTYAEGEQAHLAAGIAESVAEVPVLDSVICDALGWLSRTAKTRGPLPDWSSIFTAEAVLAGLSVLPDRESLTKTVAGPERELDQVPLVDAAVVGLRSESPDAWLSTTRQLLDAGLQHTLSDDRLVRLGVLVSDVACRDLAWQAMQRGTAQNHVQLWKAVVGRTIESFAIAPLCLLGMAAWLAEDWPLLNVVVERAVRVQPSYSMLHLLEDILIAGVSPVLWDGVVSELSRDDAA